MTHNLFHERSSKVKAFYCSCHIVREKKVEGGVRIKSYGSLKNLEHDLNFGMTWYSH